MKIIPLLFLFSPILEIYGGWISDKTFEPNEPFNVLAHTTDEGPYMEFSHMNGSIGEETLSKLPQVERIRFNGGNFEHLDFKAFTKMPKIREITLNSVNAPINIKNEDIKAISTLKKVQFLMDKKVKDIQIAEDVFKNTNLEYIVFTDIPIKQLTKARLTGLKNLKELDVQFCNIEKIDKDAFNDAPNLEKIKLLGNKLNIEPGTFDHLKKLKILKIENSGLTELNWNLFKKLKNLEYLNLYLNNIESIEVPKEGVSFNKLKELDVGLNKITTVDWQFLKAMPHLKKITLHSNSIREIKNTEIQGDIKLKELDLESNGLQTIEWDFFKNLPHLKVLSLERNSLKSVDAEKLGAHLKELKRLNIWSNFALTCEMKRAVRKQLKAAIGPDVKVGINYPKPPYPDLPESEKCDILQN